MRGKAEGEGRLGWAGSVAGLKRKLARPVSGKRILIFGWGLNGVQTQFKFESNQNKQINMVDVFMQF